MPRMRRACIWGLIVAYLKLCTEKLVGMCAELGKCDEVGYQVIYKVNWAVEQVLTPAGMRTVVSPPGMNSKAVMDARINLV
jgi:hypothetical protein